MCYISVIPNLLTRLDKLYLSFSLNSSMKIGPARPRIPVKYHFSGDLLLTHGVLATIYSPFCSHKSCRYFLEIRMADPAKFIRGNIFGRTDKIYHGDANAITEPCMGRKLSNVNINSTTGHKTQYADSECRLGNQTTLPLSWK